MLACLVFAPKALKHMPICWTSELLNFKTSPRLDLSITTDTITVHLTPQPRNSRRRLWDFLNISHQILQISSQCQRKNASWLQNHTNSIYLVEKNISFRTLIDSSFWREILLEKRILKESIVLQFWPFTVESKRRGFLYKVVSYGRLSHLITFVLSFPKCCHYWALLIYLL